MNRLAAYLVLAIATLAMLVCSVAVYGADPAQAKYGVVRVRSHGGSATVIATGPGRTLFLSSAHMFQGRDRQKPIVLDIPSPTTGPAARYGTRVIAVDSASDLALFELSYGPLPYVCPVASASQITARQCLSVGYDEMKLPPQMRPATIIRANDGGFTLTDFRPWHGRSGGALIDEASGTLVGVVSGYSGPSNHREYQPGAHGIYSSHNAIVVFLRRNGIEPGGGTVPRPQQYQEYQGQPPLTQRGRPPGC